MMRETKYHAYLDSEERTILLHSLVELKNQLIQQGRYTVVRQIKRCLFRQIKTGLSEHLTMG